MILQQAQANQRAIQSGSFAGSGTRGAVFDAALQGEQANTMRNTMEIKEHIPHFFKEHKKATAIVIAVIIVLIII